MNPESAQTTPEIETESPATIPDTTQESLNGEIATMHTESTDPDFRKAVELEGLYIQKRTTGTDPERDQKYAATQKLIRTLRERLGDQYLQNVYLYHVLIGGSLSSNTKDGFPMEMVLDVPGGDIEKFIDELS